MTQTATRPPANKFLALLKNDKAAGMVLLLCTAVSLFLANSSFSAHYPEFWHSTFLNKSLEFWINDGLMTIFFLLVGLEIEHELYAGELASVKKAMVPVLAAMGGMLVPAFIHLLFNHGTPTESGFGVPMATDIAFSLGVLSLLGKRVPASLKVFLTALAIMDDLGAILVIALFYSKGINLFFLGCAITLFLVMLVLSRWGIRVLSVYLLIGCGMWYCMYKCGIHPTISGVLLAFAIPFGSKKGQSSSKKLEGILHPLVTFAILPVFALANTAIHLPANFAKDLAEPNSLGIMTGLVLGKPLGIWLFTMAGMALGICHLPKDLKKTHIWGAGMMAGIGFTMSIFIALLAFSEQTIKDESKLAVILASTVSGILGLLWLKVTLRGKTQGVATANIPSKK